MPITDSEALEYLAKRWLALASITGRAALESGAPAEGVFGEIARATEESPCTEDAPGLADKTPLTAREIERRRTAVAWRGAEWHAWNDAQADIEPSPPRLDVLLVRIDGEVVAAEFTRGVAGSRLPPHYRATVGGKARCFTFDPVTWRVEDVTAELADVALDRLGAIRKKPSGKPEEIDHRAKHAVVDVSGPKAAARRIAIERAPKLAGGVPERIMRPVFEQLASKRILSTRQAAAARLIREEFEITQGVRQPPDPEKGVVKAETGGLFLDRQIHARKLLDGWKRELHRYGPMVWTVVHDVVIADRPIYDIAGIPADKPNSKRTKPIVLLLKAGLDLVADESDKDGSYTVSPLMHCGYQASVEWVEDEDGTVRSRSLDGVPWIAAGEGMSALQALAHKELAKRAELVPGSCKPRVSVPRALAAFKKRFEEKQKALAGVDLKAALARCGEVEREKARVLARSREFAGVGA